IVSYHIRALHSFPTRRSSDLSVDSESMFAALRRQVMDLDPTMPIYEMKTLERQLDETLSTERLIAALSAAFGALATLLAAIGLRSEEHTSELQSRENLVCRLL